MGEKNSVPAIRFVGFTDDWERRKLGDEVIEILAGGDINKDKAVENGKYPIYANALTDDGIVGYYDDYYRVKAPAVTVTGRGEVGHAQARMSYFTPVVRLLAIRSKHDCYFLENVINNHKVVVESTGVPQLTVPQLSSYDICFPTSFEEEIRVGKYFQYLARLITLHQRKYLRLCNIKKSMLERMFPREGATVPEIRFAGFTDAWEQRKLGDNMYIKARIGWQALTKSEYLTTGDYYLITGTDIDENTHIVDLKRCFFVSKERYDMDDKIQVQEGDIIVTKDGTIGKVAMVNDLDKPATLNSHLFVLRDLSKKLDNYFLLTVLNSNIFNEFVEATKTGSTLTGLPQKTFVEFTFAVPCLDEQLKISTYFRSLDHLITLHQRELERLQNIKKACLEKMFV